MQRTKLTAGSGTDDAASFATEAVRPAADALVLLFVTSATVSPFGLFPPPVPNTPTVSGHGLVWIRMKTLTFGAQNDRQLTAFRAMGAAPAQGVVTIDFGGQAQDFCAWSMFEYTGVDTSDGGASAVVQSATATGNGTTLTVALGPSSAAANNVAVGGIALELINDPARPVTPGAGFGEIDELNPAGIKATSLQTQDATPAVPGVAWTWNGAENAAAIALEVKAKVTAGGGPPTPTLTLDEQLIKRFEPVLFFHPDEKFFPVDPKRVVEHSALWASSAPFDDKNTWGGPPGASFPRRPDVATDELAALPGQGGTYKFDDILGRGNDNRFLEIGGWKDADESSEPGVTADSQNVYANRDAIADKFNNEYESSRFWYYAEVFIGSRLKKLLGSDVNLTKTLGKRSKPKLLCYYLLFPAHEQSVGADTCTGIEAQEAACHAGDWQCIAVLLEGDGADAASYKPKYLGLTGSRPKAVDLGGGQFDYRPHQFDEENRTVLKVESWRPGMPFTVDGHPRVHVALGSHSLYTQGGDVEVDPFSINQAPRDCGILDGPGPVSPPPTDDDDGESDLDPLVVLIAKLVGGLASGFFIFAWAGAIIESFTTFIKPFGTAPEEPFGDPPNPDQSPMAGEGTTLAPAGLQVPDAGPVEVWRSKRHTSPDGRTYDYVVNRTTQRWWPDDDFEKGFWGRWGQQVTNDPLGRRSGPRFPNYAVMFVQALADGDTKDMFSDG